MSTKYRLLLLTTLIISGCSMCYELIISAVSSYLMGNSTLQYSITIGLYLSALGLGSYLSRFFSKNLFNTLIKIELGIGVIGGLSSLILFFSHIHISSYEIVMYLEIIIIGTLAGAEIPLLTRIIEEDEQNLKFTISSIFSFDYIGGLIGAVAFPLLLMPKLGFLATSFLCGFLNIVAAMMILWKYSGKLEQTHIYKSITLFLTVVMILGMIFADDIANRIEDGLYRDRIILSEQTKYQKIVMTKHRDDVRLFLDGNCQFSTQDEYRYHEALVHLPMSKLKNPQNILILGGGDGMALREILKYDVKSVDLVDIDSQMIEICSTNPNITSINKDSLKSKILNIHVQDAYKYLEDNKKSYDLILIDLPDPNSEILAKLYSNVFYRMCKNSLSPEGIMVSQSISPYYATQAFWCINKTMESEGLYVKPYHLEVPSFGDWGFNMASLKEIDNQFELKVDTKYLSNENIASLFAFGKDEIEEEVEINRLTKPVLINYYNTAIERWE